MGQERVIVEISSDEEDEVSESGMESFDYGSSLDWLSDMLGLEDDPWTSDDLVVVDEFSCHSPVEKLDCLPLSTETCVSAEDSGDDCQILDDDPDKPTEATQDEGDRSDELLIVGEKGQVACRDFPHSRHLCATFPFATTSHEKFCNMCHCYVCDVPAPCGYWGRSSCSSGHCHSTDREERWVSERKALKLLQQTAENREEHRFSILSVRPPVVKATGVRPRPHNLPPARSSSIGSGTAPPRASGIGHSRAESVSVQAPVSVRIGLAASARPRISESSRLHPFRRCSAAEPGGAQRLATTARSQSSGLLSGALRNNPQLSRSRTSSAAGITHSNQMDQQGSSSPSGASFLNVPTKKPRTSVSTHQVYYRKPQRDPHISPPATAATDESFRKWQGVLLGHSPNLGKNFRPYTPAASVSSRSGTAPAGSTPRSIPAGGEFGGAARVPTESAQLLKKPSVNLYGLPQRSQAPPAGAPFEGGGDGSFGHAPAREAAARGRARRDDQRGR
ncbi:unnamed protein product [Spirodela intermedia]|uniref:Uncharacterized protein n=2 Tax=Spirodela intermedia TaxID=51605 RepID=A0A7I8KN89_SPIIN|nr:unnamed protein product [Spirodela intermedia]CAA6662539.1 unnamed protein product [Spirodela intermedia]CAA7398942.1 unnamed protein product [Spirodela intermedia]